jgi:hypothetical protein
LSKNAISVEDTLPIEVLALKVAVPETTKFPDTVPAEISAVPVIVGLAKIEARFTSRVTSPEVPPPVSPVPAVTAVMSPGLDTSAQAVP